MARSNIKQIRAALDVVRESEALRLRLLVSIHSGSSGYDLINSGLGDYLASTKRKLHYFLIVAEVKIAFISLSKITLFLLRVMWSRIKRSQISQPMN